MPKTNQSQHELTKPGMRPPRVKITYDVEIGNAIQKKELPFVGAILADLAGKNTANLPAYKQRKFTEIDRDNFDQVMGAVKPRAAFQVKNTLAGEGELNVDLTFQSMEDFEPAKIIEQVEPLKRLFEARQRLNDLAGKLDGNDALDDLLSQVVASTEDQSALKGELGAGNGPSGGPAAPTAPDTDDAG